MESIADVFLRLSTEVAAADRIAYPLAELNDLLTAASGRDVEKLPFSPISDPYRLN